ncbi:MAG: UDP-N-acetylmuramoyl-L-alanine--D-glutamate ligase [Syntrophomonadaceae bacterium]|nr:UDP-N-acetylmuramoyl-L-alanine--D-glutamate ligase [Syntrophomonadaceae bacterium]
MELSRKKVLVIGAARSGVAAARILRAVGAETCLYDKKTAAELEPEVAELQDAGISLCLGREPNLEEWLPELAVISPGVPLSVPLVNALRRQGVEIIGELELAWQLKAPALEIMAVTGTNGKTTVTMLLEHILCHSGRHARAAGNVGAALCGVLSGMQQGIAVVEVSSFQLETIRHFHPHICGILNITEDHLDRHGDMDNYAAIKARVMENQAAGDYAVLNYKDHYLRAMAPKTKAQVIWFSVHQQLPQGVFIRQEEIVMCHGNRCEVIIPQSELKLRGEHNLENVLCAVGMAWAQGVEPAQLRQALATFKGVRHRLEEIADYQNVLFVNDSKGTNPDSTDKALRAFERPIVLIAGGRAKGGDYSSLARLIAERVHALILVGEAREAIREKVCDAGLENIYMADDYEEVMDIAWRVARPGDVVLLSPACASWDMFASYEVRGDLFCRLVKEKIEVGVPING